MKAIIIEDEINNREALEMDIKRYCPEVELLDSCVSAKEGLWAIQKYNPELVFLDIEMPGMNAFQMLEELEAINFAIIFTTAHTKYAIQAFEFSATDYLLKPIEAEQLQNTVRKGAAQQERERLLPQEHFSVLKQNYLSRQPRRMAIPSIGKYRFVYIDDIIYCEADGPTTRVVLDGNEQVVAGKNLRVIETYLAGRAFFRIHNRYLISLNHITEYHKGDKYVCMKNGKQLPVAHSRVANFVQEVKKMSI